MDAKDIERRIKKIRLLVLDVDGVLTDGHIVYGDYGDELKYYDVADGLGIQLLRKAGIPSVILSGRKAKMNARRARDLGVDHVFQGVPDKLEAFARIIRRLGLHAEEVAAIGDDLPDIPVLSRAGFAVAVQNAVPDVKKIAHYVTARSGGRGAVRETADKILKLQGKWTDVTGSYFS